MSTARLSLASASPRRQALLRDAGFAFVLAPADIDEENYPPRISPAELAEYLAVAKAECVAARFPDDVTLGADTVVCLGNRLLGKPANTAHATAMLRTLSGTTHEVITGVALVGNQLKRSIRVISTVQMRKLETAEIDAYVASGQWQGKAGGYGIQDDDPFVTRMTGSLSNIVGLPMEATIELLSDAGIRSHLKRPRKSPVE